MSAITNQPTNVNFLSPLGFNFILKRAPHIVYFVQSLNIPNVSLASAEIDTPFTRIPLAGTRLTYSNFSVTFKIDEDMKNYMEIYNWLKSIGFPDNFNQYSSVAGQTITSGESVFSDITLMILNSAMNPRHEVNFIDAFPIDLSEVRFDTTETDVNYLTATATFAYRRFDIVTI